MSGRALREKTQGGDLDPTPLREKYAALGKIAELARRVADNRIALTNDAVELADAAARLDPPVADLEALARLPMPRSEDLVQFADAFEAASRGVREAARAKEAVEKEIERNDRAPCPACGWPSSGHGRPHCGGAGAPRDGVAADARGAYSARPRLRRRPRS